MQKFFKQIKSFLLRFLISIIIFFLWGNISFSQAQAQTYKVAQMEGNPERFKGPLTGTEFQLTNVSAEAIQQGILENQGFDILLMPGGSGGEQSSSLGPTGKEKVKEFVRGGGAYLGVCAGAYLGSYGMSYSLGLANVNVLQGNPGIGTLEIQFQEYANNIFTNSKYRYPNKRNIWYYNGPLWDSKPYTASRPSPHFIAKFTGVASQYTPGNVSSISSFKDKPAIVYDYYGNGCVILSSPHAEIYSNLGNWPMISEMLRWLVNCHGASFSPPPTPTRTPIPTTTPTRTPSPTPAPSVRPSPSPTAHLTPTPTTRTPSPTPSLRLSPTSYLRSSSCPIKSQGDASCDGNINDDDYFVWLDEFKNGTSSTLYADFNNDGKVDLLDFETWRRNGER